MVKARDKREERARHNIYKSTNDKQTKVKRKKDCSRKDKKIGKRLKPNPMALKIK